MSRDVFAIQIFGQCYLLTIRAEREQFEMFDFLYALASTAAALYSKI